jgi:hypothetical protein
MLFVHHNTKAGSNSRAGQNMSGSGQIHAWADFGIYAQEKDERSNRLTFSAETKYTGTESMTFEMSGLDEDPQEWRPRYVLKDEDAISTGISVDFSEVKENLKGNKVSMHDQAHQLREMRLTKCRDLMLEDSNAVRISRELGVSIATTNKYIKQIRDEGGDDAVPEDLNY